MITDEQFSKLAADQNFTPLSEIFGVKLAAARDMKDEVKLNAFVDKMAQYGYRASNREELSAMIETGQLVEAALHKDAAEASGQSIYKRAGEHLSHALGLDSPEAHASHQQATSAAADKVAQYMGDESVVMHMLALSEAEAYAAS